MDAKPTRPALRAMRATDENMPPPPGAFAGKTLHQRTKSASALNPIAAAHNRKVLGEANSNLKVSHKDDSEIGKASPGKIQASQEPAMPAPTATFLRPAVRPLALKNGSGQSLPVAAAAAATAKSQAAAPPPTDAPAAKKIVAKKSKVLRDVLPAAAEIAPTDAAVATSQPPLEPSSASTLPIPEHQEFHRTETVPLRDEPVARFQAQPASLNVVHSHVQQQMVVPPSQPSVPTQLPSTALQPQPQDGVYLVNGPQFPVISPPAEAYLEEEFDDDDQDYMTAHSFDLRGDVTETTIFNPQQTRKHKAEIAEAKQWVEANRTAEDIEDEQWDTSMVQEYGEDIFEYMREMETRMSPNPYYMEQQTEIQWSMRAVLMDWVVQVHQRFNLLPETLFLTINYIDRFLSCKVVSLGKLQLVGATAIFVAAKYEEVNCPTISEIIYMVDNGYTAEELIKAERFMLTMLQFELGWPGPMSFLRRISKADDYDLETRTLAKYFLEVTVMDERFVGCKPSFLAAGAHCMARLMLRKGEWTKAHVYYSEYTFRQLHRLLGAILECCSDAPKHHGAVFDKYTDKRYKRASTFVRGEVQRGFQLPFSYRTSFPGAQLTASNWPMQ